MDGRGKVVVVTGGSRGIGRAVVERLLSDGSSVVTCHYGDRNGESSLLRYAADRGFARSLRIVESDTSKKQTSQELVNIAVESFGQLDGWINNAAVQILSKSEETDEGEWHRILSVNLDGYFFGCQAAAKYFISEGRGGSIVNVTSGVNLLAVKFLAAYTASKGAVASLTRCLAVEWGRYNIRVNSVAPGATDTPLNESLYTQEVRRIYNERIPLGHIASPAEIADAIVFLVSDDSRYISGHELVVDGGLNYNGTVYQPLH
ncbi:MAG: SDR family oxidoreductase [Thermoplasmata archaeon]|uniref:SDR family oxidoreductase n=1 Tax=Candidatus Sysuiplasma superficiale TaxID=2823368 RepID=A0A8J8CD49_9ARCH|nr:SDR family oxidoreductase [Candidatus Sysuiplasma superficiale]